MQTFTPKFFLSLLATTAIVAGITYAAGTVTSTSQFVNEGDTMSQSWFNEVNTKLTAPYHGNWSIGWWEELDATYSLFGYHPGHPPKKVILTVNNREYTDWPAVGTQYVFGEGGLPFGWPQQLSTPSSQSILNIGIINDNGVTKMQIQSKDWSKDLGGVSFNIEATY